MRYDVPRSRRVRLRPPAHCLTIRHVAHHAPPVVVRTRRSQIASSQESAQLLAPELSRLEDQVRGKREALTRAQQDADREATSRRDKIAALQGASSMYGDRLGLSFQHTSNEHLRIAFTQIDPHDPARSFCFDVSVGDDNRYAVQQVLPPVAGWRQLEEQVNQDSDFSAFVRRMRKLFKAAVAA